MSVRPIHIIIMSMLDEVCGKNSVYLQRIMSITKVYRIFSHNL